MKRILVVDDESALRMLISGTLEIGNFEVLEADNGIDGLQLAQSEKPDLIILDVMMPGLSGYEVCEQIKSLEGMQATKVLILTAKGQLADKEAALTAKADCYVSKPFSPMQLLQTVEKILGE